MDGSIDQIIAHEGTKIYCCICFSMYFSIFWQGGGGERGSPFPSFGVSPRLLVFITAVLFFIVKNLLDA